MCLRGSPAGTSLVEAVIAIGILVGAVLAMASLASLALRTSVSGRERSVGLALAAQKLDALSPAASTLTPSPEDALIRDAPGFVDWIDAAGRTDSTRVGTVFVRRWRVVDVAGDPSLLAVSVDVAPCRRRRGAGPCGDPDARVRLTTIVSRAVR